MSEKVDINRPVKVTIEITGNDLDMCLYAMDEIRERMSVGRTEGALHVAYAEMYSWKVEQLYG